ncbi:MAG: hypothetical protein AAGK30_02995 [Pseudomonadota bacterium]
MNIREAPVPEDSLVAQFAQAKGHYVDCFVVDMPGELSGYITAFYTQPLFKAERLVLQLAARTPSTDADVAALASGKSDRFAVWTVTGRNATELLMTDASGRTMSWLSAGERLSFGSVVVPVHDKRGRLTLGPVFQSLLGAHKVYSRALLAGAARRLRRGVSQARPS